jgi:large subunit ribosomal protein L25
MSSETINVQIRDAVGSNAVKRLRATGHIPAILYGHGEKNVNLAIRGDLITNAIRHGAKLVNLTGEITDTAVMRQVQWDTYGAEVLHVDLFRVSTSESVEVTLPVHLHGEAPGSNEGGQLVFQTQELTILCPVTRIPESLEVNIGKLHLGDSIHSDEVVLPEGASLVSSPSQVVVQVAAHTAPTDEELAGEGGAEPELIRKEKDEEES